MSQETCIIGIGLDLVKYQVCDTSPLFRLIRKASLHCVVDMLQSVNTLVIVFLHSDKWR